MSDRYVHLYPPDTRDRRLLKIQRGSYITYHLPETFKSVRYETLAAAYYAAYGKEID